jgi:putative ABC transport system permease protein
VSVVESDRGNGPRSSETIRTVVEGIAPGYLAMLDIPILRGRDVQLADTLAGEVAIVIPSEMAHAFWPTGDPIGRRLTSVDWRNGRTDGRRMVVVGVFDGTRPTTRGLGNVYTADSSRWSRTAFLVRTRGSSGAVVPRLRKIVQERAAEVPLLSIETLSETRRGMREDALWISGGAGAAAALTMLLASVGLYAVLALAVQQRRREIGVRIALGSAPGRVAGMFLASGARLSVAGLVFGLPLSIVGLKFVSFGFVGVEVDIRLVAAGIVALVLLVASLAAWLPSRRAARIDPAVALSAE